MSTRIRALIALLVTLLCVPLLGGPSYAEGKGDPHRVVVCKYVQTPGDGEELHHVVIVDDHALDGFGGTFPAEFSDAHFRSLALRWAEPGEQAKDVALSECPAVEEPPVEEPPVEEPPVEEPPGEEEQPPAEEEPHQVVVCKYVRTPGAGEELHHIVIVDQHAIPGWDGVTFPFAFADAHFGSLALRWAEAGEQAQDVPLTACPVEEEPPTTTLVIEKQDFETGEVLGEATFEVYADHAPYASTGDPQVGPEDALIGTDSTDSNGLAKFAELAEGHYLVVETLAPEGYELPEQDTLAVVIDDGSFVAGGEMAPIVFRDLALGQLAIVAKRQFELVGGDWVESDGEATFGDLVKYVVEVEATGPKIFHDVEVRDYVPGFNPADTTSTARASLVPGSAVCTGSLVCEVSVEDGLVTWSAGTVHDAAGTVEMVVRFPDLPDEVPFDEAGRYTATLWNVGYLRWAEVVGGTPAPRLARAVAALELERHELESNEVVIAASVEIGDPLIDPPTKEDDDDDPLPSTGAPGFLGAITALGLLALLLGAGLVARARRGGTTPEMTL